MNVGVIMASAPPGHAVEVVTGPEHQTVRVALTPDLIASVRQDGSGYEVYVFHAERVGGFVIDGLTDEYGIADWCPTPRDVAETLRRAAREVNA